LAITKRNISLRDKIKAINLQCDFAKVLEATYGISVEGEETLIHCPRHDDNNRSAKVYYKPHDPTASGQYCWVCGNADTYHTALSYHSGNHAETLAWFESNFKVNYGVDLREDDSNPKKIAKLVKKARKVKLKTVEDIIHLQKAILNIDDKKNKSVKILKKLVEI
jgi:hypothetical protein